MSITSVVRGANWPEGGRGEEGRPVGRVVGRVVLPSPSTTSQTSTSAAEESREQLGPAGR